MGQYESKVKSTLTKVTSISTAKCPDSCTSHCDFGCGLSCSFAYRAAPLPQKNTK